MPNRISALAHCLRPLDTLWKYNYSVHHFAHTG